MNFARSLLEGWARRLRLHPPPVVAHCSHIADDQHNILPLPRASSHFNGRKAWALRSTLVNMKFMFRQGSVAVRPTSGFIGLPSRRERRKRLFNAKKKRGIDRFGLPPLMPAQDVTTTFKRSGLRSANGRKVVIKCQCPYINPKKNDFELAQRQNGGTDPL